MRELTLRVKIIVIGISLLFFPLLLFGLIIFYRTSASLDEIARIQNIQIADSMSSMIDISLTKELRIIQGLSTDQVIIDGLLTEDKIETRKKTNRVIYKNREMIMKVLLFLIKMV